LPPFHRDMRAGAQLLTLPLIPAVLPDVGQSARKDCSFNSFLPPPPSLLAPAPPAGPDWRQWEGMCAHIGEASPQLPMKNPITDARSRGYTTPYPLGWQQPNDECCGFLHPRIFAPHTAHYTPPVADCACPLSSLPPTVDAEENPVHCRAGDREVFFHGSHMFRCICRKATSCLPCA